MVLILYLVPIFIFRIQTKISICFSLRGKYTVAWSTLLSSEFSSAYVKILLWIPLISGFF